MKGKNNGVLDRIKKTEYQCCGLVKSVLRHWRLLFGPIAQVLFDQFEQTSKVRGDSSFATRERWELFRFYHNAIFLCEVLHTAGVGTEQLTKLHMEPWNWTGVAGRQNDVS